MARLEAARHRGWSYHVGYSHDYKSYFARARRPLPKPRYTPIWRTRELFDVISAVGRDIEEAAMRCAVKVERREARTS